MFSKHCSLYNMCVQVQCCAVIPKILFKIGKYLKALNDTRKRYPPPHHPSAQIFTKQDCPSISIYKSTRFSIVDETQLENRAMKRTLFFNFVSIANIFKVKNVYENNQPRSKSKLKDIKNLDLFFNTSFLYYFIH